MIKFNNLFLILSFFLLMFSFIKRNEFQHDLQLKPELLQEPKQSLTKKPAFTTTYNNDAFEIMPKYDYELFGLVVSYRLHDSESGQMIHALNKDHINVADYCVVWGQSANADILREFNFSNGQFTCQFSTKNAQAWQAFNKQQISNNHLLAIDDSIRKQIDDIKIGDQIHIKGWLSHYKNPAGYERGTSITRTDSGDGACETILVNEINIMAHLNNVWRKLLWFSLSCLILTLFIYFKSPFEPHKHF